MGNDVQTRGSFGDFKSMLTLMQERGEIALPSGVRPQAFRDAALVAAQDNPKILSADRRSLFGALRTLASKGLIPDGREAALVPFKTRVDGNWIEKVQAMPMVFGLIKAARRSGDVKDIRAHLVYDKEIEIGAFSYVIGDEEKLEHRPIVVGDRGKAVAAYAIAKLRDGTLVREFMSAEEIDKVRRAGASQMNFEKGKRPVVSDTPKGVWADWSEEMWKKTVIRRLTKRLDLSAEDMRIIQEDPDLKGMKDVTPEGERAALTDQSEPERTASRSEDKMRGLVEDSDDGDSDGETVDEDGVVRQGKGAPEKVSAPADEEAEGERDEGAESPADQGDDHQGGGDATGDDPDPTEEEIDAAAGRGREAKKKGMARKAVPGELRGAPALAEAWQRGWDAQAKALAAAG